MQVGPLVSLSPSFTNYSNTRLVEIAARVVEEFASDEFLYDDEFYFEGEEGAAAQLDQTVENSAAERFQTAEEEREDVGGGEEDDGEFEFAFVTRDTELSSPISADEIFLNGKIRPVYPVFNRDLFLGDGKGTGGLDSDPDSLKGPKIRLPLRMLFVEERETTLTTSSSSSSEVDELEGLPADTYCVWRPKTTEERCKKSSSTGSISKRWKLKGLLQRSHSEGEDSFVFLSPGNSERKKENEVKDKETPATRGKEKMAAPPPYSRHAVEKRRSYLPYRQDLVGFFGNSNRLSKNLQTF